MYNIPKYEIIIISEQIHSLGRVSLNTCFCSMYTTVKLLQHSAQVKAGKVTFSQSNTERVKQKTDRLLNRKPSRHRNTSAPLRPTPGVRYLHVLELADLLVHGPPGPGAAHRLLDVQVVAADRGAPAEGGGVPQHHQGRVTHLQHAEAERSACGQRRPCVTPLQTAAALLLGV